MSSARVLIIEDNDALRAMLFTILRHQPLAVDTSGTADEAIAKVQDCDYALILIDMNLADDESSTFLRRFRELRRDATTFIIAVRDPSKEVSIDPGVVSAILNKPLEIPGENFFPPDVVLPDALTNLIQLTKRILTHRVLLPADQQGTRALQLLLFLNIQF